MYEPRQNNSKRGQSVAGGMYAKKSLGQNFLKSMGAIRSIVGAGTIKEGEIVLEIGPGKGVLTEELLAAGAHVIAVEKDDRLIPILSVTFEKEIRNGMLTLVHGDILETHVESLVLGKQYKVIANIPYYITGLLFRKFLEEERQPTTIVVLVQKEVAKRIVARDNKESILSLSVKAYGNAKIIDTVDKKMFSPQPKVDSAILAITDINKHFFTDIPEKTFFEYIHAGFAQKRKKVVSNLGNITDKKILEVFFTQHNLNPNARAEDLTLSDWKNIIQKNYIV